MRSNLWDWQDLQPYLGPGQQFFEFCDALEVRDGVSAGPQGWGLDYALTAWGTYWNTTYLNICELLFDISLFQSPNITLQCAMEKTSSKLDNSRYSSSYSLSLHRDCLTTYDATSPYYTDTSVNNSERSWEWLICNFLGFSQDGAPQNESTIVSRLIQPAYDIVSIVQSRLDVSHAQDAM